MLVNISKTFHEDFLNVFFLSYRATERTALNSVLGIFHANRAIIGHTSSVAFAIIRHTS